MTESGSWVAWPGFLEARTAVNRVAFWKEDGHWNLRFAMTSPSFLVSNVRKWPRLLVIVMKS